MHTTLRIQFQYVSLYGQIQYCYAECRFGKCLISISFFNHFIFFSACFQRISGLAGEITKGGISSFYEPNTDCVWIIAVQRGSKIRMQFDFFDIETSPFCSNDFLKVLDGPSDISRTLINECGRKNLQDVISSGNEVFIRFKTDARNNGRGFKMRWSAIRPGQATMKPTTAKAVNPSSNVPQQGKYFNYHL